MQVDPVAVARAAYDAYVRKDRAAIEALLDNGFRFTSPLDNRIDRATYLARCWPYSEKVIEFRFARLVAADDRVFVTYEARDSDGKRFRNTEIVTVQGAKIVEVEVYFGWSLPHRAPPGGFVDDAVH
jgi:ketosteroid isomerase-like protein